jgi:hypothetical protein
MSQWKLTEETDQTWCEKCRQIKPPIYEVIYKRSPDAAAQYHYVCLDCAVEIAGVDAVGRGLRSVRDRRERQRATARANFQRGPEGRASKRRSEAERPDALVHPGGR